ncbi:acyl-CoA ligase (AMP-forming), exosortase A system-associated [Thalassotalea atypica]|uniref:acyl-CoA ligase (AMP-forming), exosortase A system-associated n=1 Tax=Thalassotalea atypica TaxID=2054316 RepID=UPI0025746C67|nr:acyl-CoA ligase (AMP-forming), exosortase A system-associated [Thalassotalea atypica]
MTSFIHQLIAQSAVKYPNNIALQLKSDELNYHELNTQIEHVAGCFTAIDLQRYERVGIYLPKTFENIFSIFGSSAAGGVFVPINPVLKAQQVQHIVNDCDIKILITNRGRFSALKNMLNQFCNISHIILTDGREEDESVMQGVRILTWQSLLSLSDQQLTQAPCTSSDMAAILYTSGSTGKPKGVVLSHNNIIQGAISVSTYLENTADDKILALLPLSFDYGLSQLTTSFHVGATCVLLDYLLPNDVIKAINKYEITGLAAVPPLWSQLCALNWPERTGDKMRYFTNSGGALTTTNLTKLRSLMPKASPYLMYGLTEAFRSTYLPPSEIDNRPTSMGKAIPNAEVMVIRPDGGECEIDEPGELVHRGPLVSLGYWNSPEKTAERFKAAPSKPSGIILEEIAVWSGDTVKRDADGYLYFVARADEMIKTSGYRVSPMEIEEVLYQHEHVAVAASLGVKHEQLGQAILVIAASNSIEHSANLERSLFKHCQKELANYMVPKKIIVVDSLPHNANGKLDRALLHLTYNDYFSE